MRIMQAGGRQG